MEQQINERRAEVRFPAPNAPLSRVTLRPGCTVSLVDVSKAGALVEAARPIRPGARVHLQVITPARTLAIAALVTRCMVWSIDPLDGVTYRGALKFDQRVEWRWDDETHAGYSGLGLGGPSHQHGGKALPAPAAQQAQHFKRGGK